MHYFLNLLNLQLLKKIEEHLSLSYRTQVLTTYLANAFLGGSFEAGFWKIEGSPRAFPYKSPMSLPTGTSDGFQVGLRLYYLGI